MACDTPSLMFLQEVKSNATAKPRKGDAKEKEEKAKKERYCDSKTMTQFLSSKEGVPFLLSQRESQPGDARSIETAKTVYQKIDDLIDFYTTWANNFPVRKNLKMSKYEFLNSVEDFCAKNEVNTLFETIINN